MQKKHPQIKFWLALVLVFAIAYSAKCATQETNRVSNNYFKTRFQDESQYIVETIISDIAEEIFFAKNHRLPDLKSFSVQALEKPDSPLDTPVYEIEVVLETNSPFLKTELKVDGPIWSPEIYKNLATAIAKNIGLNSITSTNLGDAALLQALTDGSAATIERENQKVSEDLEGDFSNPILHEKAAAVLGAFALREHSGLFFDLRSPLCRMTAHLAMARLLAGEKPLGINGHMAEAILFTLMNNQITALEKLTNLKEDDVAVVKWKRVLQAYNTCDYRPLAANKELSEVERIALFLAYCKSASANIAWSNLSDQEKLISDFVRIAYQASTSIETGHQLFAVSLTVELKEIATVFELSSGQKLQRAELINVLNTPAGRCFSAATQRTRVRVIDWGQWAMFFQRHLGHAIKHNYHFMQDDLDVPGDAKNFSDKCGQTFGGLQLYPFIRLLTVSDAISTKSAVTDGLNVIMNMPHRVPSECWEQIVYALPYPQRASANLHAFAWFKHSLLPGTTYDLESRLGFAGLINMMKPDTLNRVIKWHEMAPYGSTYFITYLINNEYDGHPNYDQVAALYKPILPFNISAMRAMADEVKDQPEQYEKLILEAAKLQPNFYFTLGKYFQSIDQDKAAAYIESGTKHGASSVTASYHAGWLIQYYLSKGETNKAAILADEAGDVYSEPGLAAKAEFFAAIGKFDEAFEWFLKIEERYKNSSPLMDFCISYKNKTGDRRFDPELDKREKAIKERQMAEIFQKGIERVSLNEFSLPPSDGVEITAENDFTVKAGMKKEGVIVALNGIRVHNLKQYLSIKDSANAGEMSFIVWQDKHYIEAKANPPNHFFGIRFVNYPHAQINSINKKNSPTASATNGASLYLLNRENILQGTTEKP